MHVEPRTGCVGMAVTLIVGVVVGGGCVAAIWASREWMIADRERVKLERVAKAQAEAGGQGERLEMQYIDNVDPWCIREFARQGKFRFVSSYYCYGAVGLCDLAHFPHAEAIDLGRIHLVPCGPHELSHWKSLTGLSVSIESDQFSALEGIETLPSLAALTLRVTGGAITDLSPLKQILPRCQSLKKVYISGLAGSDPAALRPSAPGIEILEATPIGEW